jgi:SAM-dependent methyltransferase
MTGRVTDQLYLKNEQYQDASNLNARIALHQRFGTAKIGWHRWVFDHLDLPPDARVLELGCGPGQLWFQNLDRLPVGWQVTLSDLSLGMVEQARRNLAASGHPFAYEQCDAQALPFADGSLDAVIANHMLYHVPDRAKTHAEVRRVLKPGGCFYAATNSRDNMRQIADLEDSFGFTSDLGAFTRDEGFFFLENGEAELKAWFPRVMLHRQEEALLVTEAQPLIDYILSGMNGTGLVDEKMGSLWAAVEAEIRDKGAFRIDKIVGLFLGKVNDRGTENRDYGTE